jgi:hypothetical protein
MANIPAIAPACAEVIGTSHTADRRNNDGISVQRPSATAQPTMIQPGAVGKYLARTARTSTAIRINPTAAKTNDAASSFTKRPVSNRNGRKSSNTGVAPK